MGERHETRRHRVFALHCLRPARRYFAGDNVGQRWDSYERIECLEFAAALKYSADPVLRERKVVATLAELELTEAKDLQVGGGMLRRGEKKRLSIAVELMTNPALIFLDEPTTGMDAFTAEKILMILNSLKGSGRTIIATIHQPNTQMYRQFDMLMLLTQGHTIYFVLRLHESVGSGSEGQGLFLRY